MGDRRHGSATGLVIVVILGQKAFGWVHCPMMVHVDLWAIIIDFWSVGGRMDGWVGGWTREDSGWWMMVVMAMAAAAAAAVVVTFHMG